MDRARPRCRCSLLISRTWTLMDGLLVQSRFVGLVTQTITYSQGGSAQGGRTTQSLGKDYRRSWTEWRQGGWLSLGLEDGTLKSSLGARASLRLTG